LLKTLKGSDEKHRDWIYLWYTRSGKPGTAKQFTRNQRYKLYGDGRFFDIAEDVLEKAPLKVNQLTEKQRGVREMLQGGLDQFKGVREE
jgi:arylsulfatase A